MKKYLHHEDTATVSHFIFIIKYIIEDCLIHLVNKKIDQTYKINIGRFIYIFLYIVNEYAFNENIFFIHCSASLEPESKTALLYLAKSFGGKSTISRLVQQTFPLIADDRIIVSMKKKFAVNIISLIRPPKESIQEFGIKGIFFIRKAKKTKIVKIEDREVIIDALLKQAFFNTNDHTKILKILVSFVEKNNFYYLYFTKDKTEVEKNIHQLLRKKPL